LSDDDYLYYLDNLEKTGGDGYMVDADPFCLALCNEPGIRKLKYEEWVLSGIPEGELKLIRTAVQRGQLTGDQEFLDQVAEKLGWRVESRKHGRPEKRRK
jgi:putative transposase